MGFGLAAGGSLLMPARIAVASRSFSRQEILRAELVAQYPMAEIRFNESGVSLKGSELINFLQGHDAAIIALEPIDAKTLAALPELRVIAKYGVGLDMLDLEAMQLNGVKLGWKGGVNRRAVAELVIAFAIALLRHLPTAAKEIRDGQWRQYTGTELSSKTVGIIGCGRVGKDLARLLKAFGCQILAHDIVDYPRFYTKHDIIAVDLETLLIESDVITLHTPFNRSTHNLITAARLGLMKPEAVLINAARGGLVDETALYKSLSEGRLAGAAFDVFAVEPPEENRLLTLSNFLATPHIGGSSLEAILAMGRVAINGLSYYGEPQVVASTLAPDGSGI